MNCYCRLDELVLHFHIFKLKFNSFSIKYDNFLKFTCVTNLLHNSVNSAAEHHFNLLNLREKNYYCYFLKII